MFPVLIATAPYRTMRPQPKTTQDLLGASHATFRLFYHVIFTTKFRRPCLSAPMLARLEEVIGRTLEKWRCRLVEFGGEADHVHLLIDAHPSLDLSRLLGNLKSVSARAMRKEYAAQLRRFYWKPLFWNRAYCVVSVGGRTSLEVLAAYINNQDTPPPSSGTALD